MASSILPLCSASRTAVSVSVSVTLSDHPDNETTSTFPATASITSSTTTRHAKDPSSVSVASRPSWPRLETQNSRAQHGPWATALSTSHAYSFWKSRRNIKSACLGCDICIEMHAQPLDIGSVNDHKASRLQGFRSRKSKLLFYCSITTVQSSRTILIPFRNPNSTVSSWLSQPRVVLGSGEAEGLFLEHEIGEFGGLKEVPVLKVELSWNISGN
ncbi:hypothetical protein K402DRAFT_390988 [Aulographum hederae CBS 113979]|uniref:Uncharacterized protein n=1 Tax=Aulographum hederae CBS 113979 TaxID=1176131 RepID=A0A6G1H8M5_9PEZI|nr:hypothetical protein K402DRAFT_390988 [Aulographum hederae CBS 113979]